MKNSIDLWQGDCLELMKQLPDESVDLVVTDPPFEYVQGGMKSKRLNRGTWKKQSYTNTTMSSFKHDDIFNFLDLVIPKMKKVNMFIFCSKLQLAHYFDYLNQHKKLKFDLLIWDKSSESNKYSMKSSMFFSSDIEYVVRIYQNGVHLNKIWNAEHTHADSKLYMKRQKFQQPRGIHETMKPVELLKQYIELASQENNIVLDPFMGSGSTGVACKELNRNFIGMELDEEYFKIAKERINNVKEVEEDEIY